jgi:hypothetical protein
MTNNIFKYIQNDEISAAILPFENGAKLVVILPQGIFFIFF